MVMSIAAELMRPDVLAVGAIAAVLSAAIMKYFSSSKKNYPPGPKSFPVIGNLLDFWYMKDSRLYNFVYEKWMEDYSDVILVWLGPTPCVFLNSWDSIQEAFVSNPKDFADRPALYTTKLLEAGIGKSLSLGNQSPVWSAQRKIVVQGIRKYASGPQLVQLMQKSFDRVSELIVEKSGSPCDPLDMMSLLVYNVISSMLFGKSFELDDPFFSKITKLNNEITALFGNGLNADFLPFLAPYYDYIGTPTTRDLKQFVIIWLDFIRKSLREHKENFQPDNLSDLTYELIQAELNQKGQEKLLEEGEFIHIISDIFAAGTDTTRFSLQWMLLYAATYPDMQAKIQAEVDNVVGAAEINLKHRNDLPYTEAFVLEVMRIKPLVPFALPHHTIKGGKIMNYDIPPNSIILPNIWAVHKDKKIWGDPHIFRPERFLDIDGKVLRYHKGFMPFSVGQRFCAGEQLARNELHIFTAMIFQRFSIMLSPEHPCDTNATVDSGIFCTAAPFKVVIDPRK